MLNRFPIGRILTGRPGLGLACRRFRRRFRPGHESVHRAACARCAAYADGLEAAAAARDALPLPATLGSRLEALAGTEDSPADPASDGRWLRDLPRPRLPIPPGLEERLRAIPVTARPHRSAALPRPAPTWLLSPTHTLAASLVLAVLSGIFLGNPIGTVSAFAQEVGQRADSAWAETTAGSEAAARTLRETTAGNFRASVARARSQLDRMNATLSAWSHELLPAASFESEPTRGLEENDHD